MNIGIIFAGGTGSRMNSASKPKQFLEIHGKPVLIYTLEHFDKHPKIDYIILVCLSSWIDYTAELLRRFGICKVAKIVPGGDTGQKSIFNGIRTANSLYGDEMCIRDRVISALAKVVKSSHAINSAPWCRMHKRH